ncbi:MAG: cyclopropane-fatty-acyl-phospholipid synthase [Gammaproteobacteria bacterium RBG_16_51_14]|nr:MAG: cyclopropane-fatty-acyl-phospholipid synthase [Gammaproteobacteria bacterium RBG_16_51_14]
MGKAQLYIISSLNTIRQNNLLRTPISYFNSSNEVTGFDRWVVTRLLARIGDPPISFVLWNNKKIASPGVLPRAQIRITCRYALYKLLLNPELNFGDLYSNGYIDIDGDMADCLRIIYHTLGKLKKYSFLSLIDRYFCHPNTLPKVRQNIHHHYDIGNDFYQHWLDREAMQYTCAYFPDPAMSLEAAQTAKMHHICRKLRLKPGQTVVEAGCGWGGLARFMAKEYGVKVKAYNISQEQISYAHQCAVKSGLTQQVEYIEDDFRNIRGDYDAFVSIGMLEHVGPENYYALGGVIDRSLKEHGLGLIHTIGRNQPRPLNAWIGKRIFPGAYPPSLSQMMRVFEPWSFSILDIENLRLHYAKTLEIWHTRFENNADKFRSHYDEPFIRAWRLYLVGSMVAFHTGTMQLFQVLFTKQHNNVLDWSRAYLYQD